MPRVHRVKDIQPCVLSIDVEEWFHILETSAAPSPDEWGRLPGRVEETLPRLFDVLERHQVHTTCFFVGWVARRYPQLVRMAMRRGHEIASHGYLHEMPAHLSRSAFREDAQRSKAVLEDISGQPIQGYRAAGFSIPADPRAYFEILVECGYRYDASVFPTRHSHGGSPGARLDPHVIHTNVGPIYEFPATVIERAGRRLCLFGGGYLRLFPYAWIHRATHQVLAAGRPVIFYVHPREIDPTGPRLHLKRTRRFRSYINVSSTESKLSRIVRDFSFVPFHSLLPAAVDAPVPAP